MFQQLEDLRPFLTRFLPGTGSKHNRLRNAKVYVKVVFPESQARAFQADIS